MIKEGLESFKGGVVTTIFGKERVDFDLFCLERVIVKNCSRVKRKVLSLNPCTSLSFPSGENGKSEKEIFLEYHFRNFHTLRDGQ